MKNTFFKNIVCMIMVAALVISAAALAGCGTKEAKIPDVTGMTEAEAKSAVEEAGFKLVVQREKYTDKVPEGSVVSMIDKAGETAEQGAEIRVVLSSGEGRTVPNVFALTGKEAENLIKKVDLNPIMVEEYSDTVPEGGIIDCTDSGQIIPKGADVTVTVSKGPQP